MNDEISAWLQQVKESDNRSQQELWDAYFSKLVGLARSKLRGAATREFDEEDIALSAFNSFFRAVSEQRLPKLDDRHDLWKVLVTITARKIADQRKRQLTLKRGRGLVRGESVFRRSDGDQAVGLSQIFGSDPTPEMAALVAEEYQQLIGQLPDGVYREIAQLKMQGYLNAEIARQMGCVERTVERKLERIRSIWDSPAD